MGWACSAYGERRGVYRVPNFGVITRTESSVADTFDCVCRGIIAAFTNDIDVKDLSYEERVFNYRLL